MIGSRLSGGIMGAGLRRKKSFEDEDPSAGLVNLADCMLVLAAGLMSALVIAWNIDITSTEVQIDPSNVVNDVESADGVPSAGGETYIDMGRVYQDPETGQLYMVAPSDTSSD